MKVEELERLYTIGFEDLFAKMNKIAAFSNNFPPYNIRKVEDNKYVIELALAGFTKNEVDVELDNGVLKIRGRVAGEYNPETNPVDYYHRGIAARAFERNFTLADTIEVKNAEMLNGMLKIWLEAIIPESKKPKKIKVEEAPTAHGGIKQLLTEDANKA